MKAHIGGTYWHGKEFVNTVGVTGDDRGLRACRHRGGRFRRGLPRQTSLGGDTEGDIGDKDRSSARRLF